VARAFAALTLLAPGRAWAADPPVPAAPAVTFRADRLDGDLARGEVRLRGHVEVAHDRYRLRSEDLTLRLDHGAIVFTGEARAALCPCPDPPLGFLASGGRFEPPGDLVLRYPRLAVAGVPVLGLPWLWLRTPDRIGILPPLIALKGADGLLLGSGLHLPWKAQGGALEGVDLTAGGYVKGGVELGARFLAAGNDARALVDLVGGTRVALDGRGARVAEGPRAVGFAWTLDAIRGDRALSGTVDLRAAARPFDTAAAEVSWRAEAGPVSAIVAGGALARAGRGEGPIAGGPRTSLSLAGPIGSLGSWSAGAGGVVLGAETATGSAVQALSLGRTSAGAEIDARPGPFEVRAALSGRARMANDGADGAPSTEAATAARAELALPVARAFAATGAGEAPWVHWITPSLTVRGALAEQRGAFFLPVGGALPASAWLVAGGASTALGRYAGPALRLDLRAGATGGSNAARGLLHARLGADARIAAASIEAVAVGQQPGPPQPDSAESGALLGRVRVGALTGPWLRVETIGQEGPAANRARAVAAGAWASLPGDDLAYLAASGWTGAAELSIPWTRAVRTSARADVDLDAHTLLAVRGLAEVRHPCGCLGLGLMAAHRVGREGVDVALSIDVAPGRPAR
jgi:hypothetical protein